MKQAKGQATKGLARLASWQRWRCIRPRVPLHWLQIDLINLIEAAGMAYTARAL